MDFDDYIEEPGDDPYRQDQRVDRNNVASLIFLVVTIQVLFVALVVFMLHHNDTTREWLYDNWWFLIVMVVLSGSISFILGCFESVRRATPCNFILLLLYTIFSAGFVAGIAARYNLKVVYLAFFATAIVTLSMCLLARFGPFDITGWGFAITAISSAFFVASLVVFILGFFMQVALLRLILSVIGVVLGSVYIVFVTQLILRQQLGSDDIGDFIAAVILLESEIFSMFLDLLRIINACMHDSEE